MRDWKRILLWGLCLMVSVITEARDLKRILRAIEKGDYPKTMELIAESLEEQPINPGAKYILAQLMTYDSLPVYNIDSARIRIREALDDYAIATYDDLEDLSKNGIGIDDFESLAARIEKMHYDRALNQHEVAAFEGFMELYPLSDRVAHLVRLRDSLVWSGLEPLLDVGRYRGFLETYPRSHLYEEVERAYDSLLFYTETAADRLADYQAFLDDHPGTPYRDRIEHVIFQRMTASNDPHDLYAFINGYENEALEIKAFDIGYHLDPGFDFSGHPRSDSIWQVEQQDDRPLTPVLINGKYWFMNSLGAKVRQVAFERIPEGYVCGNIQDDVLIGLGAGGGVYNRLGTEIFSGNVLAAEDLGLGVLWVQSGGNRLLHKSGFTIMEGLDDAEVLGDRWVKVSVGGQYGLVSVSGHPVTSFKYDDIWKEGSFWIFERDGLLAVSTIDRILQQLHEEVLELEFKFDDLEVYRDTLMIGYRQDRECLMDKDLRFLIPWGEHQVSAGDPYHYSRTAEGYRLHGAIGQPRDPRQLTALQDTDHWMAVQADGRWQVMNKEYADSGFVQVDSVHLVGNANAMVLMEGETWLLFPRGDSLQLAEDQQVTAMIPLQEGTPSRFLLVADRRNKQVFSALGGLIFEGAYDDIKPLNDSLFVVEERGKKGVIDVEGDQVVSQRYEALQVADGLIFLLRDGKIGGYDLRVKRAFANKYEARLERAGRFYITKYEGREGMIDKEERVVLPFEYDDIQAVNDTLYWVKEDLWWSLLDRRTMEPLLEEVTRFEQLPSQGNRSFTLFYGDEGYGLLNENAERILAPKFNSIQNVGNDEYPIFFVEEYSQTADFYVVTYLDASGERLGSFGYRPQEFERVICEE